MYLPPDCKLQVPTMVTTKWWVINEVLNEQITERLNILKVVKNEDFLLVPKVCLGQTLKFYFFFGAEIW